MGEILLVLTSVAGHDQATALADKILYARLAACVNLLPAMQSFYTWEGQRQCESEIALHIKTTKARYAALQELIVANHPYQLPEIIAIPVAAGLPAYLQWVENETGS